MGPSNSSDPSHETVRRQLIEEGARSYLAVMTAVIEYRREVQKKCREVLERHLSDYASALGVAVTQNNIRDLAAPEHDKWDGNWAYLGVKIVNLALPPGVSWSEAFCSLGWTNADPASSWFGASVSMSLPKKLATILHQEMQRVGTKDLDLPNGFTVSLSRNLEGDAVADFDKALDTLLRQWIDSWTKVGGLKAILSRFSVTSLEQEDPLRPAE
jgi:hypothetical protein